MLRVPDAYRQFTRRASVVHLLLKILSTPSSEYDNGRRTGPSYKPNRKLPSPCILTLHATRRPDKSSTASGQSDIWVIYSAKFMMEHPTYSQ